MVGSSVNDVQKEEEGLSTQVLQLYKVLDHYSLADSTGSYQCVQDAGYKASIFMSAKWAEEDIQPKCRQMGGRVKR